MDVKKTFCLFFLTFGVLAQELPDGSAELNFSTVDGCEAFIWNHVDHIMTAMPNGYEKLRAIETLSNAVATYQRIAHQDYINGKLDPNEIAIKLSGFFAVLADELRRMKQYEPALFVAQRSVELEKGTETGLNRIVSMAEIHVSAGDLDRAIQTLEDARTNPDYINTPTTAYEEHPYLLSTLAHYYEKNQQYDMAISAYESYFQWYIDERMPADAMTLRRLDTYEALLQAHEPARAGASESMRAQMPSQRTPEDEASFRASQAQAMNALDVERRRRNMFDFWARDPEDDQ